MDGFSGWYMDGIWMACGWYMDVFFFSGWYMDGMWMVDGCPFLFLDGICFFFWMVYGC
jgi:hypothetical protein